MIGSQEFVVTSKVVGFCWRVGILNYVNIQEIFIAGGRWPVWKT